MACYWNKRTRIQDIPQQFLTQDMCVFAVLRDWLELFDIPKEFYTQEFFSEVVNQRPQRFGDVPQRFVTEEMIFHIAETNANILADNFPDQFKTEQFLNKLIRLYPNVAIYVDCFRKNEN